MDTLQNSNISLQLVAITNWVQNVPAACRVRLVSRNPSTYKVYVFWIPWLAAEPYVWLNMKVTDDPQTSTFHLGTAEPVLLPGGRLSADGRSVNPRSVDTTLLSRYGPQQARKSRQLLVAPRRRRLREAGCTVPGAPEREPQAPPEQLAPRAVGDHLGDRVRDARMRRSRRDDEDVLADGRAAVVAGTELRLPERAAVGRRERDDTPVVRWAR